MMKPFAAVVRRPVSFSRSLICAAMLLGIGSSPGAGEEAPRFTVERKPLVKEAIKPVRLVKRGDGVYFIDFGRDAFGQLELELPAAGNEAAAQKVVVRLGEMLADPEHIQQKPGGSVRFLQTGLTHAAGSSGWRAALTKADARDLPGDVGPAMPFRYVELENLPEGISADNVRQVSVHYEFDDAASDFSCSDEKLNAIWKLCKYSIKATSFAAVFVDGDRERKPYEADACINQLGWYACTGDITLPRYSHEYLMTHPTWPTEWIMFSVFTGFQDYQYTGEKTSVAAFYDDLKAKTLRGLEREDGLISTVHPKVPAAVKKSIFFNGTLKDIVDWPAAERDGYEMLPVNTVVNAFHCRSLRLMAALAEALGKKEDAADFVAAATRAEKSLNAQLFDPATGLYVDGEGSRHSSLHANMFPLAFGLTPPDRREKVAAFVQSRGMACSVYGAQYLMEALFDNGKGAYAVKLMEAGGDRSWRHMVEDVGTTITLEAWDSKYKPNQDWNHAWGAAPANLIPRKVLGVEPLEAGYSKALIWPRCSAAGDAGAVSWARGKVPTVKGPIVVDWRREAAGFRMAIELPAGSAAEVRLPADWGDAVQVDGRSAQGLARDRSIAVQVNGAGKHLLSVGHD